MINANELRLGNLLTIDNEEFHPAMKGVPLKVTGIRECESLKRCVLTHSINLEHIVQQSNFYYDCYSQFICFVKPILLTDLWVARFGFDEKKEFDLYSFAKSKARDGYLLYFNDESTGIYFQFVHEFQNLFFAIMKEELTLID